MIYLTSDLHLNHDKEFIYKARGFDNIWDMNRAIIDRWNETVKWDDDVYILGDCGLGGGGDQALAAIKSLLQQLQGHIHIIRGNHDSDSRVEMYETCYNVVDKVKYADMLKYKGYHFYLSHYTTLCSNLDTDKPLKARTINLCGHSHATNPFEDWDKGFIYHCEVDAHDCRPVLLDDIIEEIKEKLSD
jgi:calcineurin-like phosphoesterase family protein